MAGDFVILPDDRHRAGPHISGHQRVAKTLRRLGITHVFCFSGTPIDETLAACHAEGIRAVGVRRQEAGVFAALALNFISGELRAAALLSAGPGITNAMTGILVAHDNAWPLLVIGGRRSLAMHGKGSFQDLDALPLVEPITKWATCVNQCEAISSVLIRAWTTARKPRPGPVYLDITEDALLAKSAGDILPAAPAPKQTASEFSPRQLDEAASLMTTAKRPLLILGKGLRWSTSARLLRQLVENHQWPFITTPMARGLIPDDHSLCCNAFASLAQSKADAVMILGARKNWLLRYGAEIPSAAVIVQVDADRSELSANRAADMAFAGELDPFLRELAPRLDNCFQADCPDGARTAWSESIRTSGDTRSSAVLSGIAASGQSLSLDSVMAQIDQVIPDNAICVLDGNISMQVAQKSIRAKRPFRRLNPGTNGCMGIGIPYGIGAKLACPAEPVVVITGDAAFGLNALEIETAVRYGIALVIIIINNNGISGDSKQRMYYPPDCSDLVTVFQAGLRYEKVCQALGGEGCSVATPVELRAALEIAIGRQRCFCINVPVDGQAG